MGPGSDGAGWPSHPLCCRPCACSPIPSILVPCPGCLSCLAAPLLLVCCACPCQGSTSGGSLGDGRRSQEHLRPGGDGHSQCCRPLRKPPPPCEAGAPPAPRPCALRTVYFRKRTQAPDPPARTRHTRYACRRRTPQRGGRGSGLPFAPAPPAAWPPKARDRACGGAPWDSAVGRAAHARLLMIAPPPPPNDQKRQGQQRGHGGVSAPRATFMVHLPGTAWAPAMAPTKSKPLGGKHGGLVGRCPCRVRTVSGAPLLSLDQWRKRKGGGG